MRVFTRQKQTMHRRLLPSPCCFAWTNLGYDSGATHHLRWSLFIPECKNQVRKLRWGYSQVSQRMRFGKIDITNPPNSGLHTFTGHFQIGKPNLFKKSQNAQLLMPCSELTLFLIITAFMPKAILSKISFIMVRPWSSSACMFLSRKHTNWLICVVR